MLTLIDVERAIAARAPELGALIVRYLAQDDPEAGRSELAPTAEDDAAAVVDVPAGAITLDRLHAAVSVGGLANRTATERKLARRDAFAAAEASPFAPPRLRLGLPGGLNRSRGHRPSSGSLMLSWPVSRWPATWRRNAGSESTRSVRSYQPNDRSSEIRRVSRSPGATDRTVRSRP
jgi:hypothetical protein